MKQLDKKYMSKRNDQMWEEDVEEYAGGTVAIKDSCGNVVATMQKEVFAGIMMNRQPMGMRPRV